MSDQAKIPDGALIAAAIAAAPAAQVMEAEDPNAVASTVASAPAAGTASSAPNALAESTALPTSASSVTAKPLHTLVAAHLESVFQMVFDQHKAIGEAREHAVELLQRVESETETAKHELADSLRRLIGML